MLMLEGMMSMSIRISRLESEMISINALRSRAYRQKDREHLDITCRDFHNSRTESESKATWRQEPPLHKNSERDVSSSIILKSWRKQEAPRSKEEVARCRSIAMRKRHNTFHAPLPWGNASCNRPRTLALLLSLIFSGTFEIASGAITMDVTGCEPYTFQKTIEIIPFMISRCNITLF